MRKAIKTALILVMLMLVVILSIVAFLNKEKLYDINTVKSFDDHGVYELQYIQLTNKFKPKELRDKINHLLRKELIHDSLCEPDSAQKDRMMMSSKVYQVYTSKNVLSFVQQFDSYCGGAYPDQGEKYYIFNLRKAQKVNFLDSLINVKDFKYDLARMFKESKLDSAVQGCKSSYEMDSLDKSFYDYLLVGDSALIRLSLPHVIRGCESTLTVACPNIIKYLDTGSFVWHYCEKSL